MEVSLIDCCTQTKASETINYLPYGANLNSIGVRYRYMTLYTALVLQVLGENTLIIKVLIKHSY